MPKTRDMSPQKQSWKIARKLKNLPAFRDPYAKIRGDRTAVENLHTHFVTQLIFFFIYRV
jgi:hypothetical protein